MQLETAMTWATSRSPLGRPPPSATRGCDRASMTTLTSLTQGREPTNSRACHGQSVISDGMGTHQATARCLANAAVTSSPPHIKPLRRCTNRGRKSKSSRRAGRDNWEGAWKRAAGPMPKIPPPDIWPPLCPSYLRCPALNETYMEMSAAHFLLQGSARAGSK